MAGYSANAKTKGAETVLDAMTRRFDQGMYALAEFLMHHQTGGECMETAELGVLDLDYEGLNTKHPMAIASLSAPTVFRKRTVQLSGQHSYEVRNAGIWLPPRHRRERYTGLLANENGQPDSRVHFGFPLDPDGEVVKRVKEHLCID